MTTDLDLLKETVREAGQRALALRSRGLKIEHKPGGSPVTNADLAIDEFLKNRLLTARPDYGWLSEETADNTDRLTKSRLFLSDPIDGTSAYMKDRPWWSVCAAVIEDGRPVAGVVYAPTIDEFYEAAAGEGARLNGAPINVKDRDHLEGASVLAYERLFTEWQWPQPWPPMTVVSRNSLALRLSLVGSGQFDATISAVLKHDWDLAAGDLIVHEAGGQVTDHLGRTFIYNRPNPQQRSLVCAGPSLHSLLLQRLSHIED
jgi:myo-inositol-1(or 4)-monophosphatase